MKVCIREAGSLIPGYIPQGSAIPRGAGLPVIFENMFKWVGQQAKDTIERPAAAMD